MGSVLVVCGTGTEIGKTHFSRALLMRAGRDLQVLGYKPVESGCSAWSPSSDHKALADASTFHVKHLPEYCLADPISPHLAARREGRAIDLARILARIQEMSRGPELLLVELAGGLFSPLNDTLLNVDLLRLVQTQMADTQTVLIAPDRLGVLHDIGATTRAAVATGVRIGGVVLNAPLEPDSATGLNAAEVPCVTDLPLLAQLPRAGSEVLAVHPQIEHIYSLLLRNFKRPASIT